MNNYIKIKIPDELKKSFEYDKKYLEYLPLGKSKSQKLQLALKKDMIVEVLILINEISDSISINKGFYKEFKQWLDFVLKEIMKTYRIDVSSLAKERDIYLAMYQSEMELRFNECKNLEKLIKHAEYIINKKRDDYNFNSQINTMCNIFIKIGLNDINIEELVDISYEHYMMKTKKIFEQTYEELSENSQLEPIVKVKK